MSRQGKVRAATTGSQRQTLEAFLADVDEIRLHRNRSLGGALKKPLLLLLVLSMLERGELRDNRILYSAVEEPLRRLIRRFGGRPTRSGAKPEQPFDHLQSAPFWHVLVPGLVRENMSRTLNPSQLRADGSYAWLEEEVYELLSSVPEARAAAADFVLSRWWPETVHGELRAALGLPEPDVTSYRAARDPEFATRVLENYRYRCAVCGFDAVLNELPFGLDAAHIRWHSQNGPDTLENGLALCKLHHWALDRGVVTVRAGDLTVRVSPLFVARDSFAVETLERLDGRPLSSPRGPPPGDDFLSWHGDNVFME